MTAKNNFLMILFLVSLAACGHDPFRRDVISHASSADSKMAVIVGKVMISPRINDDGDVQPKGDDTPQIMVCFTRDHAFKRSKDKNADLDLNVDICTEPHHVGEYFAMEIEPTSKAAWIGLSSFAVTHKHFLTSSSETWVSFLRGFSGIIPGSLKPGHVYDIGTLYIELADKAYFEIGDQQFDKKHVQYLVPKRLDVIAEPKAAAEWIRGPFKYTGPIETPAVHVVPNSMKSSYKQVNIQTVYQ